MIERKIKKSGPATDAAKELKQFAVFSLGEEKYAVDIGVIREIIRPIKITHIPGAPSFIEGVVNIRGDVIPVIEMRKRFDVQGQREAPPRMIIVKIEEQWVGIQVDSVTEVIRVPASDIKPPPRGMGGDASRYLAGVCSIKEDLIVLLNLNEILTGEEKVSLKTIRGA